MSKDLGKVSIIVPVYNVEKYFDECIRSILNQTYRNLEIIIVDDGTEDNCGKMADEYAGLDNRVVVFHKENGGIAEARNLGLDHATGEYFCFVDSDDYCEPDFIEKLINAIVKTDADLVFCNYYSSYVDKIVPCRRLQLLENGKEFSSDEFLEKFYESSMNYAYTVNKIYKRDLFKDLRFKKMMCEDAQIMLYIIDQCKKIVYISDALYYYRRRKSSTVNSNQEKMLLAEMQWIYDHMETLKASKRQKLFDMAQKLYLRKIFERYQFCGDKTRKEIRKRLKSEMKEFVHNTGIDKKLRIKYLVASKMPYLYGKLAVKNLKSSEQFWD